MRSIWNQVSFGKIPSAFFASRYVGMEGYGFSRGVGNINFKFKNSNLKFHNPVRGVIIVENRPHLQFKPRRGDIIEPEIILA